MSDVITVVNIIPNLLSGETNRDSESNLAVNPANPLEMVATAFTPSPNIGSPNSPMFYSKDGGLTWTLVDLIAGRPVRDQTVRFATKSGRLYAGVLLGPGALPTIKFDILRTNDFSGLTTMTLIAQRTNDDQPYVEAITVPSGPDAGKDRVYVGSNDWNPPHIPATIDLSLDAAAAVPTTSTVVVENRTVVRDSFPTRPAVHADGTVYAIYYAVLGASTDVVVVRDDNWGNSGAPFTALIDTDGHEGIRVAVGVNDPQGGLILGQQRIGSDLAITIDPRNSTTVYVCWGDQQGGTYTLYVRKSTDKGATWSANLRTVANATNPALAVNSEGRLGFLYQQLTGLPASQLWQTTLELSTNDFASITSYILSNTPAATPPGGGQPYLGDYLSLMAVGPSFHGIFTANNTPDLANFPNGAIYQRNANFVTKTLLAVNNVTPVPISIDPFVFKVVPGTGKVVTVIADKGNFGHVCVGSFTDEELTIDNSGTAPLSIKDIKSLSPEFEAPSVLSYPIKLGIGDSIGIAIRFVPKTIGFKSGKIEIDSDDPASPHFVDVSGLAPTPRLSLIIANSGGFGDVCIGHFADEPLIVNNSGQCPVTVFGIAVTPGDFLAPHVIAYPLSIAPGSSLSVPIRFVPASIGTKAATITVTSSDPASPHKIDVKGEVPSGKITLTGSLCFGGVKACCRAERTIAICNVGDCALHVTSVKFKRKNPHWKLVNNPFPAKLHPGSCLSVVVRYKATERIPIASELIITSDDPATPVKTLDVMAYTIWDQCCCKEDCDRCNGKGCDKGCCEGGADDCCSDEDDD